jgi:catechol 2,3-dioxygenase-like lactoylglutathione lyase family enzyme
VTSQDGPVARPDRQVDRTDPPPIGSLHHLELWVADLAAAERSWGWLLGALGYRERDRWPGGASWSAPDGPYVVLESGPDVVATRHDRLRPGLNHLAFHGGSRSDVDELAREAQTHGWALLFSDRHPYAGGPQHYAAYLEDESGFEVELVARETRAPDGAQVPST